MKISIGNLFFRGLTLASKFLFVFFIGKYSVDESNLGLFGIIASTTAIMIYFLGFDFYVFNTREILNDNKNRPFKFYNQLYFHLALYLIFLPPFYFFLKTSTFLPNEFIFIICFLVISEHIGQETFRLFATLEKSFLANAMLFIRSGAWVWLVFFDFFVLNNSVNLKRYLTFWVAFSTISSLFSLGIIIITELNSKLEFIRPNFIWIFKGIKTAAVFFISTLSIQVINFSDRFIIDFFLGKKYVGAYTAYANFSNAIEVFTFSAITIIAYPILIKSYKENIDAYKQRMKEYGKKLIILSIVLILLAIIIGPFIFDYMEKPLIIKEQKTFYTLLIGVLFLIASNIYHYDLYIKGRDNIILRASLIGAATNIVLNIFLIKKLGIQGAAVSTAISYFSILIYKRYYSAKKDSTRPN